jgi:hypothetical protein
MVANHHRFIVLCAALVLSAVVAPLLLASPLKKYVTATEHCTHYTPPYSQDNQWSCSDAESISHQAYGTNGYAYRDDNIAAMNQNENICIAYSNGPDICNNGNTNEVTEGSSGGGAAFAFCDFANNSIGLCKTDWH